MDSTLNQKESRKNQKIGWILFEMYEL